MITFLALFLMLFVFTMTSAGIVEAVGTPGQPHYDIQLAAELLQKTYLKTFGLSDSLAIPISYIMLALPAVLSFYLIRAMFVRK